MKIEEEEAPPAAPPKKKKLVDMSPEELKAHNLAVTAHLRPHQFKPGHSGNPLGAPKGQKRNVSLVSGFRRFLKDNPDYVDKIAATLIKCAAGEIPENQARVLNLVSHSTCVKQLLDRVDGPVEKKIDMSVRADKTVVLHDGPALRMEEGKIIDV